jgi:hypothetical protein
MWAIYLSVYVCWTILVFLGWIPLVHGEEPFKRAIVFYLLISCWTYVPIITKDVDLEFSFLGGWGELISLSVFEYECCCPYTMSFEVVTHLQFLGRVWKDLMLVLQVFDGVGQWSHQVLRFSLMGDFYSIALLIIVPLRFCISS